MIFWLVIVFAIIGSGIALFAMLAPQLGRAPFGEHLMRISASKQYKETKFENEPLATIHINIKQSFALILELVRGAPMRQPKDKLPSQKLQVENSTGAFLTWFGHSTFLYELNGKRILFDPMLGMNASPLPFGVRRYAYDLPASADELPSLDAIIISHDHYDHLDYGTIQKLKDKTALFIMPLGVGSHLTRWGVAKQKIIELDWWEETHIGDIQIVATPSQHFSGRSLTDRQKTLWSSWVIASTTAKVFFGGDSGYFPGFKEIGQRHGPFDLTLLDSGQYNARWEVVHMFPEQSVLAHKDLGGKVFMPIHWSAFTLALHDWTDPVERAILASTKANISMVTPMIGERWDIRSQLPQIKWWREKVSDDIG